MLRTVAIQLDKERRLKYDLNAFALLKEKHGYNLLATTSEEMNDPVAVRAVLWAGLLHEDPAVTIEQVGSWVDVGNLGDVTQTVAEALLLAKRQDVTEDEERPPFGAPPTNTGMNSTSSGSVP